MRIGGPGQCFLAFAQQIHPSRKNSFFFGTKLFEGFRANPDFRVDVRLETRSRWNQMPQNHVFLQADQVVDATGKRRFGQDLGRLLEIKLSLWTAALVIPSNCVLPVDGFG